jgi:hypothetical protein
MSRSFQQEIHDLWSRIAGGWCEHLDQAGSRLLIDGVRNQHDAGGSYEGVTRMLWGLGGWLSQPGRTPIVTWHGKDYDLRETTRRAFVNGTDPDSPGYWGVPPVPGERGQWTVETGQVAFALWQSRLAVWDHLDGEERERIVAWLDACAVRPAAWSSNWALFWALNHRVREVLGERHDAGLVESVYDYLDRVYAGNGWYDDGPEAGTNHWDDYNLWVFASHVLALAQLEETRSGRMTDLLERVRLQMRHVPYFFGVDGSYTEYGRSLSYAFARLGAMVWAYQAGAWPHSTGMLKRLAGRHLRWYIDRGKIRSDGTLLQGLTGEGSPAIRETYISTGATYWAMQAFGAFWSLPDDDPFWTVEEEPLPVESGDFVRVMPEPGFVVVGKRVTGQVLRYTSKSHHYRAKYGKFVYSTSASFNVGLADGQPLPDSMLAVVVGDERGHRHRVEASMVGEPGWLRFRWRQFVGGGSHEIDTTIVPFGSAHIRVHRVTIDPAVTAPVRLIEGAAPLGFPEGAEPVLGHDAASSWASDGPRSTGIQGLAPGMQGQHPTSFGAPDAHALFANQVTPWVEWPDAEGTVVVISVVWDGERPNLDGVSAGYEAGGTVRVVLDDAIVSVPAFVR